jgi:hypothetical protein
VGGTLLTPLERRYLIWRCCVGAAIVNAIINGGLGWLSTRGVGTVPLWHIPGVVWDLWGTAFGVTFGTCLGTAYQVPRDLSSGRIEPVAMSPGVAALIARFPDRVFKRSVGLGTLSCLVFALPLILLLAGMRFGALDRMVYIEVKAGFAAFVAAIVTPFLVLRVLGDVARGV